MNYRACLHTAADNGSLWTTLAVGHTRQSCIHELDVFLARQPWHHWGITSASLIKLYSMEKAGFIETLPVQ